MVFSFLLIYSWNTHIGVEGRASEGRIDTYQEILHKKSSTFARGKHLLDPNGSIVTQDSGTEGYSELPGKQIRFEKISIEQGLSQSNISSIIQDSKGYMWFGTDDGLNRYDGYSFNIYRHEPNNPLSISDNSILSLYEDDNKVIWVGTSGKGLNRFDPEKHQFVHYRHDPGDPASLVNDTVTAIIGDNDGYLWIGTVEGLDRYDLGKQEFFHYTHNPDDLSSLSNNSIGDLLVDQQGNLWIGTLGGGLNRYDPVADSFIHYKQDKLKANQISSDFVSSIKEDKSGNLWIGTRTGGLNYYDRVSEKFFPYGYDRSETDPYGKNSITALDYDNNGNVWIGTNGSGIQILNPNTGFEQKLIQDLSDPATLSSDIITDIFADPAGNMWIGTSGAGVNRYDQVTARFNHYRHIPNNPVSLSANSVTSVAEDLDGKLWIGYHDGGLDSINRNTGAIIHFQHDPEDVYSLSSDEVKCISVDRSGTVWIGTSGGGINRYWVPNRFTQFRHDPMDVDSLSSDLVNVIFEDREGAIWIGTNGGGLDRFNPVTRKFFHYKNIPNDPASLSNNSVLAITQDRAGNLWIGTRGGGISVLDKSTGKFTHLSSDPATPNSLGDTDIFSLYEDEFGVMWIGTFGSGLDRYEPESGLITHYRASDGLPNNIIYGILDDKQGYLWLSTNLGISQFDVEQETFKNFDASDGLQGNEFNLGAYLLDSSGMIFFGGINGLTAFYSEDIKNSTYKPPVILSNIMQNGEDLLLDKPVEYLESVVLNWPNNNLEFEYLALNFKHSKNIQYAYQLVGFDNEWNYVGNSRNGRYTNIPSGTYNLRIKATNSDGVWNEEGVSLEIKVVPPFWETWWFIGLVTIVIMGSVISGYRLRIRSIESRSQELEAQVKMRTEEIEQRRMEMESLYAADAIIDQNLTKEGRLRSMVDVAVDLLHGDTSTLFVWDANLSKYLVIAARGFHSPEILQFSVPGGHGNFDEIVKTSEILLVNDLEQIADELSDLEQLIDFFINEGVLSSLFLPVKIGNELFGVFNVNYFNPNSISEQEIRIFKVLTQHSTISIQNAQLFEQLREIAISEERSRLARDLHDSAKQKAFAALAQLGAAGGTIDRDHEASKQHLLEAEELVYEVLQELIILIQEMYPVALQEKGLANSLREFVYEWDNQWDIDVTLEIKNEIKIPLEIEQSLYRIFQESLANVARHSQAKKVDLSLIYQEQAVHVMVRDNGIGFDPSTQVSGLGLRSMRERVDLINGELHIKSTPGDGTLIEVIAPLSK